MHCPMCQHPDSKILDSDAHAHWNFRRRQCVACGGQYDTSELPNETLERLRELLAAKQDIEAQIAFITKRKFYAPRSFEESPT